MSRQLKYDSLGKHLREMPVDETTMSYAQIEAVLGRPLPSSVHQKHWRQWWANTRTHSQGRAWLDAGWYVERADGPNQAVVFRRRDARPSGIPPLPERPETAFLLQFGSDELSGAARRLVDDYAEEFGTTRAAAAARLLDFVARQRRRASLSDLEPI